MDYKAIYMGMTGTVKTLLGGGPFKLLGTGLMVLLFHQHAVLFYAFTFLVFLDCFTRWMSISHARLVQRGEKANVLAMIKGIKKARSEGLISSDVMKHRFIGKIAVYIICTVAAATADITMLQMAKPVWLVSTVISYLVLTELLSIIENLNDAGIEAVQGLVELLKRSGK